MYKYSKTVRQAALREILEEHPAADQSQVDLALRKRGIRVTQATISRDIRELGLAKARIAGGGYAYTAGSSGTPPAAAVERSLQVMFRNFVVAVKDTSHMVLIKTHPGNANGVAQLIDSLNRPDILGTIAGDDTVMIVVDTESRRTALAREFRALLQGAST